MDESTKKPVMIGVIVACLALAVFIWIKWGSGSKGGLTTVRGQTWMLCRSCNASWEIPKRDYFKYIEEHVSGPQVPPLPCPECGEESGYRAVKCAKCGKIFFYGTMTNTFADQCPDCGYSQDEQDRKEAAAKRAAGG